MKAPHVSGLSPLSVATGSIPPLVDGSGNLDILRAGWNFVFKFGSAPDIDTANVPQSVWDLRGAIAGYSGLYTYSAAADISQLSSSSAADTQLTQVQGLDANWELTTQTIALTGQTPVNLTTPLIRVFRMKNVGAVNYAGDVYCCVAGAALTLGVPNNAANVRAVIVTPAAPDVNNQTLMAIYTTPDDYNAYIASFYLAIGGGVTAGAREAEAKFMRREFGGVFQNKIEINVNSTGAGVVDYKYALWEYVPPRTDIEWQVDYVSGNDMHVDAGFAILLNPIGG